MKGEPSPMPALRAASDHFSVRPGTVFPKPTAATGDSNAVAMGKKMDHITDPDFDQDRTRLAQAIAALPHLKLRGLMAIPEPTDDPAAQAAAFARVRQLQDSLNLGLDTLSMGMSHDLEAAIAQGATWVRIGTALFGARDYGQA